MLRFFHVTRIVFKYAFIAILVKLDLYKKPRKKLIRNFFEEAGGAFVKFGQILSLRVDFLPAEYSLELLDLLDKVKPFPYEDVVRTFKQELGARPEEIFTKFEAEPFAAASFGQVHIGWVGEEKVAIKVIRPGIEADIGVDFLVLRFLAFWGDIFFRVSALHWKEFAREFERWTRKEIDYTQEAENVEKVSKASVPNPNVIIPKVYYHYSTKKILVQEFIDGVSLTSVFRSIRDGSFDPEKLLEKGINIKKVPRLIVEEIMREYFFIGAYHADPHPGNILLLPGDKIGLIDFGIVGTAVPNQKALLEMFKATSDYRIGDACKYLLEFGGLELKQLAISAFPASVSEDRIDHFLETLANQFFETINDRVQVGLGDLRNMRTDYAVLMLNLLREAESYRVRFPKEMVVFGRALSVIGFLAKTLDKEFRMSVEFKKFIAKYDENTFLQTEPPVLKRISREIALEKLTNWLSYLYERDLALYKVVNSYIDKYNLADLSR